MIAASVFPAEIAGGNARKNDTEEKRDQYRNQPTDKLTLCANDEPAECVSLPKYPYRDNIFRNQVLIRVKNVCSV